MEITKRFATASRALVRLHEAVVKDDLSEMERIYGEQVKG